MNFSIGEMSKMHNVSIQTLRYYDKVGIFKPAYIDKHSNYRYYTIDQFIVLDLIKHCKLLGLSLDEIKELIGTNITVDSILDILKKQEESLEKKISELEKVKSHINFLKGRIVEATEIPYKEVVIKEHEEKSVSFYDYQSKDIIELEMNIRKALKNYETGGYMLNSEIIFKTSYEDVLKGKVRINGIMIYRNDNIYIDNVVKIPKGRYLSLCYDDNYRDTYKYYKKLVDYAKMNNIELIGDFYEYSIMPKIDLEGNEKSLTQLEIRIK